MSVGLLRCAGCALTGNEADFVPAVNPERRARRGEVYSDVECPACGDLAFPVEKMPDPLVVVLHEQPGGTTVAFARWAGARTGVVEGNVAKRIAVQIGLGGTLADGGQLRVERVPTGPLPQISLGKGGN